MAAILSAILEFVIRFLGKMHCISPYAIIMCVECVCVLNVCVCRVCRVC